MYDALICVGVGVGVGVSSQEADTSLRMDPLYFLFYVLVIDERGCVIPRGRYDPKGGSFLF